MVIVFDTHSQKDSFFRNAENDNFMCVKELYPDKKDIRCNNCCSTCWQAHVDFRVTEDYMIDAHKYFMGADLNSALNKAAESTPKQSWMRMTPGTYMPDIYKGYESFEVEEDIPSIESKGNINLHRPPEWAGEVYNQLRQHISEEMEKSIKGVLVHKTGDKR